MRNALAPVMILAGGTGGHVFPALAVANELRAVDIPVVWMGTRKGLEAQIVPKAGLEIEWLNVTGLRGKGKLVLLVAPVQLARACLQAWRILRRRRPGAVLGMGGFVSGPGAFMAWLTHRPLVVHEQNAIAGFTNRCLASIADRVLEAMPGTFRSAKKAVHTGNPVRPEILQLPAPDARLADRVGLLRLLVLGGSQGARALNQLVPRALALLPAKRQIDVRHQAGDRHIELAHRAYREAKVCARVDAFIEDMAEAYGWADLVLCRAGAMTIAELAAVGVASILIPYPFAVDDHQTRNADYLVDAGAAVALQEAELTAPRLTHLLVSLDADRPRLLEMARAARGLAKPDAARQIAAVCREMYR